jgi:S1-C subfamily serine protease
LPAGIDGLGKVSSLRLAGRSATEMRAEQIFRQAGAAVYMVKALPRLGSAVAISDHELLTNCHVLGDLTRVTLLRDHKELPAQLVSAFDKGDRCVLKTEEKLPAWVRVRSYDSITVGEQAFSIGTPVGLELTLAEGIVSSKRVLEERRYIQTSAPVSPGSSGGGLFDAQGQLLGVTTFQIRGAQNLNFAIAGEEYAK